MVECESGYADRRGTNRQVLIDTWWNVNSGRGSDTDMTSTVLIDTWWNVNLISDEEGIISFPVLIDTWWNVNCYFLFVIRKVDTCFNRYMVECEYKLPIFHL